MAIVAGTWTLQQAGSEPTNAETAFGSQGDDGESLFYPDKRLPVPDADYAPGGKYRSIVKLFMRYVGQDSQDDRHVIGTGWLIRNDILVTAGHCAFDWSQNRGKGFGRAIEVKAYIGYKGKDSIGTPNVQFRTGVKIVTTEGWIRSGQNRQNDVAFIQLNKGFDNVTPFKFEPTPIKDKRIIGVVGYPGDKKLPDRNNGEPGAEMYEEFRETSWDLADSGRNMLEYQINTYKGQSGSPVLIQGRNCSIGAHVYGGDGDNSASTIEGEFGNSYKKYISAFFHPFPVKASENGVSFIDIEAAGHESFSLDEEGFWDGLKSVINCAAPIASNIIGVARPFLGPAAPIAALAGAALGAAGKACSNSGSESMLPSLDEKVSSTHRAILAEASLQAVLNADTEHLKRLSIPTAMMHKYKAMEKDADIVGPRILPAIMGPALSLSVDSVKDAVIDGAKSSTESKFYTPSQSLPPSTSINSDPFTQRLLAHPVPEPDAESLWAHLPSILSGTAKGAQLFGQALTAVSQIIPPKAESGFDEPPINEHMSVLAKRAVLAEAALQSLQEVPAQHLEESLFSNIISVASNIGSKVIKYAPAVIDAVNPIIGALVSQTSGSESDWFGQGANGGGNLGIVHPKKLATNPFRTSPEHSNGGSNGNRHVIRHKLSFISAINNGRFAASTAVA